MAAEAYDSKQDDRKPTQGMGNAGGRPIRPVLFAVAAVIALILGTLAVSRRPGTVNEGISESGPIPVVQYSPASTADTARGQDTVGGTTGTVARPATAPMSDAGQSGTSVSGSSSLPAPGVTYSPSPTATPAATGSSAGQNFVAPPGPAANRQGAKP